MSPSRARCVLFASLFFVFACADDDGEGDGNDADRAGVGAACSDNQDCVDAADDEGESGADVEDLVCLTNFTGGYCGLSDCTANEDCPDGSACVAHDDGTNYCFRQCLDKSECNVNRPADAESNCSANVSFVEPDTGGKACVPPSGG